MSKIRFASVQGLCVASFDERPDIEVMDLEDLPAEDVYLHDSTDESISVPGAEPK